MIANFLITLLIHLFLVNCKLFLDNLSISAKSNFIVMNLERFLDKFSWIDPSRSLIDNAVVEDEIDVFCFVSIMLSFLNVDLIFSLKDFVLFTSMLLALSFLLIIDLDRLRRRCNFSIKDYFCCLITSLKLFLCSIVFALYVVVANESIDEHNESTD